MMAENDIDRLTRGLMQGTAEQPSPSLNSCIMAMILQEKRRVFKYYVKKRFTPAGIFAMCVVYMLMVVGVLFMAKAYMGETATISVALRHLFPILLTVASGISCFFLFTQVDNWMKSEELKRKQVSKE